MKLTEINTLRKSPRKGTVAWERARKEREEYMKAFAKDPHGRLEPGDKIVGPNGTATFIGKRVAEAVKTPAPTKPMRRYNPNARIVELNDIDIWDEHGLEEADLEIEFDYEEPSHSDHPYGQGTAREDHGAVIGITEIRLLNDVNVRDMNDNVAKVLTKGTDLMKEKTTGGLPLVSKANLKWLEDQVAEKMLG